jgi:predicted transcriptional regulator
MKPRPELNELPLLSSSEWRVFSILARGEATIRHLLAQLAEGEAHGAEPMSFAMLQTLVRRLEAKGYVESEPQQGSKAHLYRIIYPFDAVLRRQATKSLVNLSQGDSQVLLAIRDLLEDLLTASRSS